jgi:type I restriction enzyme S subunit
VPYVRPTEIQDDTIQLSEIRRTSPEIAARYRRSTLRGGDLLLSIVGTIGKVAIVPPELTGANITQSSVRIRPGVHANGAFLRWMLKSPLMIRQYDKHRLGTGVPRLNVAHVRELTCPVAPLNEQRRIVAKLEELHARSRGAREALDAVPPLLEKLRQSILAAAFRGDLTKDWRAKNKDVEPASVLLERIRVERRKKWEEAELAKMKAKGKAPADDKWKGKYVEPAPADAAGLPELPGGWCWASVEQLATKVVDGVHAKPNYVAEGVPFLTVKNLTAGPGISFEDAKCVTQSDHTEFSKRTDPERGDILISKDGTLGVARLVRTSTVFSIFVSLALVKPVIRDMSEFLEMAFWSPYFQERFKATGSGLLHIHLVDLRGAALPIAPVDEQKIIAVRARELLARVDILAATQVAMRERVGTLERATLASAFRGGLVPQYATDGPAVAMLVRPHATTNLKAKGATNARRTVR